MQHLNRRAFLKTSVSLSAATAANLGFLASLSRAAASDTTIHPADVVLGSETDRLLKLLRKTSPAQCVSAFVTEIKGGLSYQQFLTVLFLAAVENGDPHQVAQVYGAHRISSEARIEERLLPLFWVLNRIKQEQEPGSAANPAVKPFQGTLPEAGRAPALFREAMLKSDSDGAERAALALARDRGPRHTMHQLWEFAPRNIGGNLGHPAIALANSLRALDAMGWQHSEVALRYVTRYIAGYKGDATYEPNLNRLKETVGGLPDGWTAGTHDRSATLELYTLLRSGKAAEACALICSQLLSTKVKAGSVWDAISLAAADAISRHTTGGATLGAQVHAVTTTNALRYGFHLIDDGPGKLLNLLQAAGVVSDFYVRHMSKEGKLREVSLVELQPPAGETKWTLQDVFDLLPFKGRTYTEKSAQERAASDKASQIAFGLLGKAGNDSAFMRKARSFLCVKASLDPHDIKYPAAVFEDAALVSAPWRPYLLASSVHALHGAKSADSPALVQVRDMVP